MTYSDPMLAHPCHLAPEALGADLPPAGWVGECSFYLVSIVGQSELRLYSLLYLASSPVAYREDWGLGESRCVFEMEPEGQMTVQICPLAALSMNVLELSLNFFSYSQTTFTFTIIVLHFFIRSLKCAYFFRFYV